MKNLAYFTSAYYIKGFFGEHRFLSNFFPSPIRIVTVNGSDMQEMSFPTAENLYQRTKASFCKQTDILKEFETCDPAQAKKLGKSFEMTPTQITAWNSRRGEYMKKAVYYKFAQNPNLLEKLLATRGMYLEESNTWGDKYWGVHYIPSSPVCGIRNNFGDFLAPAGGENMLGNILTYLREEFFLKQKGVI